MGVRREQHLVVTLRRALLASLVATLLATPALSQREDPVRIAAFHYPPLLIESDPRRPGLYIELLRELYAGHGLEIEFAFYPFARAVQRTVACERDLIGAITPDNSDQVLLPDVVPLRLRYAFYVAAENGWRYSGVQSLRGLSIGNVRGYNYRQAGAEYQRYLETHPEQVTYFGGLRTAERFFRMIASGRLDVFNIDRPQARWAMKRAGLEHRLREAGVLPNALDAIVGFCPQARGRRLRELFDTALRERIDTPAIRALYVDYDLDSHWREVRGQLERSR